MSKFKKVNNITEVVLVNNTLKTIDLTPGAGKRWHVSTIQVVNGDDVQRTVIIRHFAEAAATNLLSIENSSGIGANGRYMWPNNDDLAVGFSNVYFNKIVEGVEIIRVAWNAGGASTGSTDADGLTCQVLEEAI